ncbi:MAG: pseudouridine-5'-phosphate glycosidase [Anaerolineae bacterium]|nr:pseudouridine-5'-phosphate glycosidase [Anaerolineales bacterium]MCQ3977046.1 pseudouridine-5-phosphate glycosidase [Anaerolineae bacterium]
MPLQLNFQPEVKSALEQGRAVVALESTVITHGLPSPENVEVARAIEAAVREQGAVPATIAILGGEITVGLTPEQLLYLGSAKNVRKCSRRDFSGVVARREDGATTVAGTMMVAHWAGIRIFATGGIGGVHRGQPFDESADLLELGRTPVAVVCAGAKAILDLPLTLEVLETQGVPVIGYQTDEFPAFYSRSSGLPLELRVETPQEIAAIIKAHDQLGLNAGTLIAQPIPAEAEWPAAEAQEVIEEALQDAAARHITGKAVTPYLLQRVSDLSGARSKTANIALLLNNARLAAQIALALTG